MYSVNIYVSYEAQDVLESWWEEFGVYLTNATEAPALRT